MDFLAELKWRGLIHEMTPGIEQELASGPKLGYIGFDPTAPSLTIGNYIQVMLLTFFQRAGHIPVVLLGGATSRIGDPSGKDEERQLKPVEELEANLRQLKAQFKKLLNFDDGPNKAIFVDNYDFYKDLNVLDFLRNVGKHLTINYMLAKESVKNRMERESGISFTEFSYQLLQGYDFARLYKDRGLTIQMGGSDQYGNITTGVELTRRLYGGKVYVITTPLLTKADGKKFGKSESGNIWLDPDKTSPYRFYQFWINADDADLPKLYRYFSLRPQAEILQLESDYRDQPQKLKQLLAEELTVRIHSRQAFESVIRVTNLLFNRKASEDQLKSLSGTELAAIAAEIPHFEIPAARIADGINIVDLMAEATSIAPSKSEARKAIKNNAVAVNKVKISGHQTRITGQDLLLGKYLLLENGKKNKYMILAK